MVYALEYDMPWYNDNFHDSGELERKMDKTFSHFSYICYLYKTKLLSDAEFEFFNSKSEKYVHCLNF